MSTFRDILRRTLHVITERTGMLLLGMTLILIVWLGSFLFRTLYETVIEPTPIDEQSISSRQEKLNITQYEQVTASIDAKRNAPIIPSPPDPF